jgi:hypothetical protein
MNVRSSIQRAAPVLAQYGSIDQGILLAFREAAAMAPQILAELGSDAFTLVASPPLIEWPDSPPEQQQRPWWKFWG